MRNSKLGSFKIEYKSWFKQKVKHWVKNLQTGFVSTLVSFDCSSFAQSFVQVGLDGVQEVWCVDVMFIQLAAARSQSRG